MESYLKGKDNSWYKAPNNIVGVVVNPITGEKMHLEADLPEYFKRILEGEEIGRN